MTAICQKKNKGMRAWLRKNAVGYAFLMPFLVLFAIFVIVPVGVAMYYSLTNYNMIQAPKFVGLSNYAQLILDDDVFLISLKNTLLLAVVTGPLGYFASFLMAWIITLVKKGRGFFSMAFYAPSLGLWRVQAGPFNSLNHAEDLSDELNRQYPGNFVVAE